MESQGCVHPTNAYLSGPCPLCGSVGSGGAPQTPQSSAQAFRGWVDLQAEAGPMRSCWWASPTHLLPSSFPPSWTQPPPGRQGPAGAGRELGWGQQKVHKSLLAKTSALSRWVEAAVQGSDQGINHNSPTIDPFAAAIRKTVLVLSIF